MRSWFKGLPKSEKVFLRRLTLWLLVFILICPLLFLITALINIGISPIQALKIFGYPGVSKNYLVQIRNPWILDEEGGQIALRANVKFRYGFFAGIDFKNIPATPDRVISINYNFLQGLNSASYRLPYESGRGPTSAPASIKKTLNKFFLQFWKFDKNFKILAEALRQKDAVIAVSNADFSSAAREAADFLALTIENTSGLPLDQYLFKRFSYNVEISQEKEPAVILRVHLFYNGFSVYKGRLRIYVPLDAYIAEENADIEETAGASHVFEKNLEIQPGKAVSAAFRYKLPQKFLKENTYTLFLYKQPSSQWQYQISVKTSEDFDTESNSFETRGFLAFKQGDLDADKIISARFKPTSAPLFLSGLSLEKRDEIVLEFNRDLSGREASDGLNYAIEDTNAVYPETTDQVLIRAVLFEGRRVRLKLAGMSRQPGEKYAVTARNLKDRNGMEIEGGIVRVEVMQ